MVDWREEAIDDTRRWLERAVIGLDLCPFARAVHARGQIRMVVSEATTPEALLLDLGAELAGLRDADPEQVDTVLLVHPRVLGSVASTASTSRVVKSAGKTTSSISTSSLWPTSRWRMPGGW